MIRWEDPPIPRSGNPPDPRREECGDMPWLDWKIWLRVNWLSIALCVLFWAVVIFVLAILFR